MDNLILDKSLDENGNLNLTINISQIFDEKFVTSIKKEVIKSVNKALEYNIDNIVEEVLTDMGDKNTPDHNELAEIFREVIERKLTTP